ncbi:hypothetical protein D9M71_685340 [compost metagenome]
MPASRARLRTAGEASGRSWASRGTMAAGWWVEAAGAATGAGAAGFAAGSGAGAATALASSRGKPAPTLPAPSTSMRISSLPTAMTSPGWPPRARTLPLTGEGISTVALSVMTSATTWSSVTVSPTLTNHSTSSTCAMPSPISGILMTCVPIQTSMTRFNAAPTREGPGKYAHSCACG